MAMYCMQCSALGDAPLIAACACGSTRWRGTYELPERPSLAAEGEDRRVLEMVDAIRAMINSGAVALPAGAPNQD